MKDRQGAFNLLQQLLIYIRITRTRSKSSQERQGKGEGKRTKRKKRMKDKRKTGTKRIWRSYTLCSLVLWIYQHTRTSAVLCSAYPTILSPQ